MARVVSIDAKKQQLDLTLLPHQLPGTTYHLVPSASVTSAVATGGQAVAAALPAGCLVMGRLSRVQVRGGRVGCCRIRKLSWNGGSSILKG